MRLSFFARIAILFSATALSAMGQQSIPRALQGNWRVTSVLPTQSGCWAGDKANNLVGTTITYAGGTLRWKGEGFAIAETQTRSLTAQQFQQEYAKDGGNMQLTALGIRAPRVLEYDLQHEDADITDVTTEIPGDTVWLASPNRIVVSVCGTYFEAVRGGSQPLQQGASTQGNPVHAQAAKKSGM